MKTKTKGIIAALSFLSVIALVAITIVTGNWPALILAAPIFFTIAFFTIGITAGMRLGKKLNQIGEIINKETAKK